MSLSLIGNKSSQLAIAYVSTRVRTQVGWAGRDRGPVLIAGVRATGAQRERAGASVGPGWTGESRKSAESEAPGRLCRRVRARIEGK